MDRAKTGALIAAARKEKNLTQKDLAQTLHVSDRAVSKWERGAGFPDVGLLEPLAAALDLNVLDLLRGERTEETDVHAAVQEALDAFQQRQRIGRREVRRAKCLFCGAAFVCVLCLLLTGFLRIPIRHTILAGVYESGMQTTVTEVCVEGNVCISLSGPEYWGQIQVPLDQISIDSERKLNFKIPIKSIGETSHARSRQWSGNIHGVGAPFIGNNFCLTVFMRDFAFDLSDNRVIATTPAMYARHAETYGGAPLQNAE